MFEEGIYRVNGNYKALQDLRLNLEMDCLSCDLTKVDVHVLTGVVKCFFRELPEPLLIFPIKDRIEYSSIYLFI